MDDGGRDVILACLLNLVLGYTEIEMVGSILAIGL